MTLVLFSDHKRILLHDSHTLIHSHSQSFIRLSGRQLYFIHSFILSFSLFNSIASVLLLCKHNFSFYCAPILLYDSRRLYNAYFSNVHPYARASPMFDDVFLPSSLFSFNADPYAYFLLMIDDNFLKTLCCFILP